MADFGFVFKSTLVDIADAIREKTGKTGALKLEDMPDEILSIETGITPSGTKEVSITANGTVTRDVTSYASVEISVDVPTGTTGGEEVSFDDRNDDVKDYLAASAQYSAANRSSVSVISQYADTSVQDQDCPKPFLGTYNLAPGEANTVGEWTVTTTGMPPRMLKLDGGWNVRDCGGWSCDGGRAKYGLLFRGARLESATAADLALLAAEGVKLDLDLRDSGNASGSTRIPGASYYNAALTNAYAQMIQNEASTAATACITAMQSIVNGNPVYIHCASGADRTGSICGMLEALLGVSAADIDRDYEMTCFADVEQLTGRTRMGSWNSFWTALDSGQGSQKMNVAKWLRDNGATTALINAFRRAVIDGTPSDVDIPTYTVTNNLTGCTTSNSAISVDGGSAYAATLTPNSGYAMTTLTVTMGGVDITSSAVSNNAISIASVTGNVVITALAEAQTSYTNLVRQSQAVDSTAVYNGGLGYRNGYYISGGSESANAADCVTGCIPYEIISGGTQPTDVLYIKGYTGAANASHTRMNLRKTDKTHGAEYNGFLSGAAVFDVEVLGTGYYKLTPKTGLNHSFNYDVGYLRFSFAGTDGANIIITRNEVIE